MDIYERLKQLRIKENLNLTELANILNLSNAAISKYENKKSNPTAKVIIDYCNYFNVSADYILFGEKAEKNELSENEYKLLEKFRQLNEYYKTIADHEVMKILREQQQQENNKMGKSSDCQNGKTG